MTYTLSRAIQFMPLSSAQTKKAPDKRGFLADFITSDILDAAVARAQLTRAC